MLSLVAGGYLFSRAMKYASMGYSISVQRTAATIVVAGFLFFCRKDVTADTVEPPTTRIVGGFGVANVEAPFICSVRQRVPSGPWSWTNIHLCGGTIVNENWLLTSAHCIFAKDVASLGVVCGVKQARSIQKIELKPDYVNGRKGNDLALIFLRKPLVFGSNAQPIPIFDQSLLPSNVAVLLGYGITSSGEYNGLQAAVVRILTSDECNQRLGALAAYLTSDTICTDNGISAAGTCTGDSGGPVIIATDLQPFNLLAIPSWTVAPCGSGPSMHTLISAHIGWILNVITPQVG